jgi:hypothetical protein
MGFRDAQDLDAIRAEILAASPFADVYIGAAPRTCQDGTVNGIARVWCVWVDVDTRDALQRLARFPIPPSIVIRSGSDDCAHAYWPQHEPLAPADAQRANRRLALHLGADMASTDPARILRPAGTLNHKHSPPSPVTCTRLELDSFAARQIVGDLPDSDHYRPRERPRATVDADPDRTLAGLVRTVTGAPNGNRNASLHWSVCRLAEHADAGEINEVQGVIELKQAALAAGLSEVEVDATIRSGLTRRAARQAA